MCLKVKGMPQFNGECVMQLTLASVCGRQNNGFPVMAMSYLQNPVNHQIGGTDFVDVIKLRPATWGGYLGSQGALREGGRGWS